jgi:hypothetical protein
MSHPAEQAVQRLANEVHSLISNKGVKPGDTRWYELQAKGCALSMLRGMIQAGAHTNPSAAEAYRKSIRVKGLLNGDDPFEAEDRH